MDFEGSIGKCSYGEMTVLGCGLVQFLVTIFMIATPFTLRNLQCRFVKKKSMFQPLGRFHHPHRRCPAASRDPFMTDGIFERNPYQKFSDAAEEVAMRVAHDAARTGEAAAGAAAAVAARFASNFPTGKKDANNDESGKDDKTPTEKKEDDDKAKTGSDVSFILGFRIN